MATTNFLPGLQGIPREWVEPEARSFLISEYTKKDLDHSQYKTLDKDARKRKAKELREYYKTHPPTEMDDHVTTWVSKADEEWDRSTRKYTNNGKNTQTLDTIRLFHDIAFGAGLDTVLQQQGIIETIEGENGEKKSVIKNAKAFEALKEKLEAICRENSERTGETTSAQPLNRALTAALVHQWVQFRDQPGLGLDRNRMSPREYRGNKATTQQTPQGTLFAGMLYALISSTFVGSAQEIALDLCRQYPRLQTEDVQENAYTLFTNSLFSYREGLGTAFATHAVGNIKRNLSKNILRKLNGRHERQVDDDVIAAMAVSNNAGLATLAIEEPLHRLIDPAEIPDMLSQLSDQERKVLTARFGLDGQDGHTLESVGNVMKISKERVRQIQLGALSKIRQLAEEKDASSPDKNGGNPHAAGTTPSRIKEITARIRSLLMPDAGTTFTKVANEIGISPKAMSSIIGNKGHAGLSTGGALSDHTRDKITSYLTAHGRNTAAFLEDFDALRRLTGYRPRKGIHWRQRVQDQQEGRVPSPSGASPD